ncbi:MAG: NAD(P)/FAD-dependent oxidoreductase [Vicinamibacteria bacterium]
MTGPPARVLIAGGGVAGLETLLALRHLTGERLRIEVLAPEAEFSYRQFAVAEPFSLGEVARFDLTELIEAAGGVHRRDALSGVDARAKLATTEAGAQIAYDALVIAVGATPRPGIPGALTYRGPSSNVEVRRALLALDRRESRGLAFAVPAPVHWSLPICELALLAGAHLADIGDAGAPLHLVTAEREPLSLFGPAAGARVRKLLEAVSVKVHTGVAPARMVDRGLALANGSVVECDQAVSMPMLEAAPIPGLPQGPHGFIATDARMRVDGVAGVFAVGDASWFPIKQGGLAAQQADVAAATIAAEHDPAVAVRPFRPRLRAALLTGDGPLYLRAGESGEETDSSEAPLWWPPSKVAGLYLAPFIAARARETNQPEPAMIDLDPASPAEAEDHREMTAVALACADADADLEDYTAALRWLAVAEGLDLTLPAEYALRREQWRMLAA